MYFMLTRRKVNYVETCINLKKQKQKCSTSNFKSNNITKIRENLYNFDDLVELLEKAIVDKNNVIKPNKDTDTIIWG